MVPNLALKGRVYKELVRKNRFDKIYFLEAFRVFIFKGFIFKKQDGRFVDNGISRRTSSWLY